MYMRRFVSSICKLCAMFTHQSKNQDIVYKYSEIDCEDFIRGFVAETLSDEIPAHKCFIMCYLLSVYLTIYEIKHTIKSGMIKETPHYIIILKNGLGVDPTAQQIDSNYPQVLFKNNLYSSYNFNEVDFEKIYKDWEYPILHNGKKEFNHFPQIENESKEIDIIPYLRILFKAYFKIKKEIICLKNNDQQIQETSIKTFLERTELIAIRNDDKRDQLGIYLNNRFDELIYKYN